MLDIAGPLSAGTIIEPACAVPADLAAHGYVEEEFTAAGTARSFEPAGEAAGGRRRAARASDEAPFRTRIVVRRPAASGRFSGTFVLEWLNVSSGFDADPDWAYLHEEIFREGHAYAAVSAQALGVLGGRGLLGFPGPPAPGLRASDPVRYGELEHPGDKYAFDIFGQVGHALREHADGERGLGGLIPDRVLAIGESQSAFYLTSYINTVHPLSPVFDGFLVHSRGAGAAPLAGTGLDPAVLTTGVPIRPDGTAPVLVLETESDLVEPLAYGLARQPDSERFRLWEVAGTAHADAYLIGAVTGLLGIGWQVNEGPHRFVAQAALHALHRWVRHGTPPPRAARIELAAERPPVIARDGHGIAIGGVRTPHVDVPAAVLSGAPPPGAPAVGWLVGSTTPIDDAELRRLYGDKAGYLAAYTRSLDAAIADGFLLPAHREMLLAAARAAPVPG